MTKKLLWPCGQQKIRSNLRSPQSWTKCFRERIPSCDVRLNDTPWTSRKIIRWSSQNPGESLRQGLQGYPQITYYWTGIRILDHSYLVGNLTNSKIAETIALEPLKSWLLYQQFSNLLISERDMSGPRLGDPSNNRWSGGSAREKKAHSNIEILLEIEDCYAHIVRMPYRKENPWRQTCTSFSGSFSG